MTMRVTQERSLPDWCRSLPWERRYLVTAARWITEHFPPTARIVDCGCGLGQLFVLVHESGFRDLTGIEARRDVADAADELLSQLNIEVRIQVADAYEALPRMRLAEQAVLVTTNWHHAVAGGLPRLFDAARIAMAPGSVWVFDALDDPPPAPHVWFPEPVREGFGPETIARMADRTGFKVMETIPCGDRTLYVVRKEV